VLKPDLTQAGIVDGLGHGEQIYSVRFLGPRGYVVTFKQTDPLYSLDLSNPAKPAVTGELKITGYSSHLQPAGDGRLIGIGQQADAAGVTAGTQVSFFDVADPAAPRRLGQFVTPGGWSEAEREAHAVLWWPQTNMLVLPISVYAGGDVMQPTAAVVLRVTDSGVTRVGTITQPADSNPALNWSPGVHRSLVVGDTLWTMSDYGLEASNLSTLDRVGWLPSR
jgi:uncharacterized secreted protein with C-terminal beta-propeller domain